MDKITIVERINSDSTLLSMPKVLSELLEETTKDDFSSEVLAQIILKDASLTARILQLANSSFYARVSEITTVHQAVAILGATTVKCFALSTSILREDQIDAASGLDSQAFFGYILSVSTAADRIAHAVGYSPAEEATIAGLLHDVGVLYLIQHYPAEYGQVLAKQTRGGGLIDAECEIFGIDHCELGHHLATSWRLPERICDAIAGHHSLGETDSHDKLANIIKLSVLLSFDRFSDCESNLEERLTNISATAKLLDLSQPQVDEVMKDLLTSTLRMASDLGVDIGSSDNLLSKANQEIWKSYLTIEHLFKERQELSERLLKEEREKGMAAAKNVALATLSHYLNNAVMAIYGRSQLMLLLKERNELDRLVEQVPRTAKIIKHSIYRITAVMQEMKEIKPSDQVEFYNQSEAMNIDDRIDRRMEKMAHDDNITVPQD